MKYLFVESIPYEGEFFKSFSSDKSKEELIKEFDIIWENSKPGNNLKFYNLSIYRCMDRDYYEIITLDEFWEQNL